MMPLLYVHTNCPDAETARAIGEALVSERLAACYNLEAIESGYRWKGAVERGTEAALILKTRPALWPRIEARIAQLHPYEVPAIVGTEAAFVSAAYGAWIEAETVAP